MQSKDTRSLWLGVLVAAQGADDPTSPEAIAGEPVLHLAGPFLVANETVHWPPAGGRFGHSEIFEANEHGGQYTLLLKQILGADPAHNVVKCGSFEPISGATARGSESRTSLPIQVRHDVIDVLVERLSATAPADDMTPKQPTRRALRKRDKLTMVFQPIVEIADRKIVGAEALARFPGSPSRSPSRRFAEMSTVGLRVALELRAVQMAIEALPDLPRGVYLTFNVSPVTLIMNRFQKLIESSEATRLVAEVTEHAPISDYARLGSAVEKLRASGMRLAVDDAGAGFASLKHILKLSPDLIKLDLTLIRNIQQDPSKQALAAGLISFADKSGATIIAEGIERAAEAKTLVALGVRHGQGYYLGRPGPLPLRSPPVPASHRESLV